MGGVWLTSYLNKPAPEMYLIPAGFRGELRVVYGEPGGVAPPVENGRRVLQIPPDGVTIIQPEYRSGLIDNEYYLVDAAGGRTRLSDDMQAPVPGSPLPRVHLGGAGSVGGGMADGSSSSESPLAIEYTYFTVGEPNTSDVVLTRQQRQVDSLMTALVERSRTKK